MTQWKKAEVWLVLVVTLAGVSGLVPAARAEEANYCLAEEGEEGEEAEEFTNDEPLGAENGDFSEITIDESPLPEVIDEAVTETEEPIVLNGWEN